MHMLVIVNPEASRAEIATDELSRWFSRTQRPPSFAQPQSTT